MLRKTIINILASIACIISMISCSSEFNTNSLGQGFAPANSSVSIFRRQVYVEFSPHSARVWGEAADLVSASVEGSHVNISFTKDSLAFFVYGFSTADTTVVGGDASLTFNANTKTGFAIYLNGTSIYNPHGPAIQSLGNNPCYIVLSSGTRNNLTTVDMTDAQGNANACLYSEGVMQVTGTGTLNIRNLSTDKNRSNAISAASFGCNHNVNANLRSEAGHDILAQHELIISNGKWDMLSYLSNFKAESVQLIAGTYTAHCMDGSFIETNDKYASVAMLRSPVITSLAPFYTSYADSATMAAIGYVADSLYYPKQYMPDFEFKKDSTYSIYYHRDTIDKVLTTFKPIISLEEGYLLISNSTLTNRDQIFVTEK